MKYFYLCILVAAISINLTSQNKALNDPHKRLTKEKLNLVNHSSFKLPGELIYFSPLDGWAQTEMITQLWDNNNWLNMAKTNFFYDANGLMTNDMNYSWNGSAWEDNTRTAYTYNANNLLETDLTEEWDGNAWVETYRSTYTYNGQGKMLTWLSEANTGGVWENISLYTYTYTGDILTELLTQNWDGSTWVNSFRSTYEYNTQGLVSIETHQMWLVGAWMNMSRSIETYNQNNLVEISLDQSWDGGSWVDNRRYSYTYDGNNKLISALQENYDSGNWENSGLVLYTYDGDGNNSEVLMQDWVSGNWENMFRMLMSYQWTTDVETINPIASEYRLMNNYPNPFNPSTTIEFSISQPGFVSLKVYDILGKEIATLVNEGVPAGSHNVEFRMQNLELSSGIYFYQLKAGNYVETKKMTLLK
jgi:hypothetical protein